MKYLYCLIILLGTSCSQEPVTVEELQAFVRDEENGLRKTIESNGYSVDVTYRPTDLWVQQELGDKPTQNAQIEGLRKKYNSYYYFILSLSRDNKEALHSLDGGMGQYSELVQVMSFRMPDYVNMTTNANDTIPVGDFILNRTYGLSSSTDLLFVFSKEKILASAKASASKEDKDWVQFNLNEFGLGLGNQRFRFSRKELDNAPQIKFASRSLGTNNDQRPTNN